MHRLFSILAILTLALSSCDLPFSSSAPDVLTTTTILADVTRNVVGDRFSVGALIPVGADPHSYQPTPQDATKINKSKVLIINGAEYESFLNTLLQNANTQKDPMEASAGLRLQTDPEGGQGVDPHVWLDPNNMIVYVENIRDGLTKFDPEGAATYKSNASAYIDKLQELDAWINGQVSQIPPHQRLLVTNHEALGYFADRYGFTVVGTVVKSFSSDASPSAQQMAGLVDQIKLYKAPAIFLDAPDNPALAQQIATETGVKVITNLHLESLTEGPPAATYIDMMKYNVTQIVNALK